MHVKAVVVEEIALQLRTRAAARGVVLDSEARAVECVAAVFCPVAHADPTELIAALAARHVIAAAVLFNRRCALWAVLGVRLNVLGRRAVFRCFAQPFGERFAHQRLVPFIVQTSETV